MSTDGVTVDSCSADAVLKMCECVIICVLVNVFVEFKVGRKSLTNNCHTLFRSQKRSVCWNKEEICYQTISVYRLHSTNCLLATC